MTRTTAAAKTGSNTTGILVGLGIAAVVAAIILALALGGTGDEAVDTSIGAQANIPTEGVLRQVSFVDIDGEALPGLDDTQGVDPAIGMTAPTITASYFDNTEITVDLADGQPRVLIFLAHWCPHCQAEVKALVSRFETQGIREDVELLAISTSVNEGGPNHPPSRWLINERWPLPVLRDSQSSELAASFGLSGFPFLVVINADGEVMHRASGSVPAGQWDSIFDRALAG